MDHTNLLAQNSSALITPPTTSSRYSWCRLGVLFSMSDLACRLGSGGTWGGEAGRWRVRQGEAGRGRVRRSKGHSALFIQQQ